MSCPTCKLLTTHFSYLFYYSFKILLVYQLDVRVVQRACYLVLFWTSSRTLAHTTSVISTLNTVLGFLFNFYPSVCFPSSSKVSLVFHCADVPNHLSCEVYIIPVREITPKFVWIGRLRILSCLVLFCFVDS